MVRIVDDFLLFHAKYCGIYCVLEAELLVLPPKMHNKFYDTRYLARGENPRPFLS